MKTIISMTLFVAMSMAAFAQINTNDPALKLWLKADTLPGATFPQPVPVWADSSTNGTIMAAPAVPLIEPINDLSNHTPQLILVTNNSLVFKAVSFRQRGNPNVPDPVTGHWADRMWQTNHLDANDPTLIGPSSDITIIVVYQNNAPNTSLSPDQTILAKRGPSSCPWDLGVNNALQTCCGYGATAGPPPNHIWLTYAGITVYGPGPSIPSVPEWGIVIMNVTAGGDLSLNQYYPSLGGWSTTTMTGVARGGTVEGVPTTIAFHTQGAGGCDPALNPWCNGTGERAAADIAEAALYSRSLSDVELANIENQLLLKYFLKPGPAVVVISPQDKTIAEFDPVSFGALVDGTPPFTYQWLKGATPIPGATAGTYSLPSATRADAGLYSLRVTNSISNTNSLPGLLTVIPDTNAPVVTSALRDYVDNTRVVVTFSELVSFASATNSSNYTFNNGVTVAGVVVGQTNNTYWSNYLSSVVVTTTPITSQSTLTVNGVQDRAGNTLVNSQLIIPVPGVAGSPPSANRLLWLSADTGVTADVIGVSQWSDQSGAANSHNANFSFGNAQLGQAAFPNSIHPAVSFDGTAGLAVENTADFNLQNFTVYVVGDVDSSKVSDDFIGTWEGWVLGISDGSAGVIKWVSHTTAGDFSMEPAASHLGNRVPALIRGTFKNPGDKTLAVNTALLATQTGTAPIDYATARGVTVGALFPTGAQNLVGDISEILFYSSVSSAQDSAVESYLAGKYFKPSLNVPVLVSATRGAGNYTTVTAIFSDTVNATTATNKSNYAINNGVTVSAATMINGKTVSLTTSPINVGPTYTLTANGVTDWAGNPLNTQIAINVPSDSVRLQDSSADHLLVIEAEIYSQKIAGGGQSWTFTTNPPFLLPTAADPNFSGTGCMVVLPDSGSSVSFNPGDQPVGIPQLDYRAYFTTTGTNYIWVRGSGDSDIGSVSDSINLGLDGVLAYRISGEFPQAAGYAWGKTASPTGAVFVNTTTGVHVINAWMREDGFGFDKLVLSTNPAYSPTGLGPPASPVGLPPITVTWSGGSLTLSWVGPGILQSATSAVGTYTDVAGASSPWPVTPTGVQLYYRIRSN